MARENDDKAAAAWRVAFGCPMPPSTWRRPMDRTSPSSPEIP